MEIIIVVGIMALILVIALPLWVRLRANATDTKTQAELNSLYKAINMFYAYNGRYPTDLRELSEYISIPDIEDKYELNPEL